MVQPYLFRQGDPHPRIVANKAAGVYDVEQIEDYKKNEGRHMFKVKWLGYEDRTWEPLNVLKSNIMLHTYLKQKNLLGLLDRGTRLAYGLEDKNLAKRKRGNK